MRPRRRLICALITVAAADLGAQSLAIPDARRAEIDRLAGDLHPKVETRRDIHRHPELGYRETRTSALVADRLRALRFDVMPTIDAGTIGLNVAPAMASADRFMLAVTGQGTAVLDYLQSD
jgi:metal-dependent amidase/aminoacylase/carboxypeptidase family protein